MRNSRENIVTAVIKLSFLVAIAMTMTIAIPAQAQQSTIRVACDGASLGAEISINGTFKGECPIDVTVAAGTIQLEAVKTVDGKRLVQKQAHRLGAGVMKRTEIEFGGAISAVPAAASTVSAVDVQQLRQKAEEEEKAKLQRDCETRLWPKEERRRTQELEEATQVHAAYCYQYYGEHIRSCGSFDNHSSDLWERKYEAEENLKYVSAKGWCKEYLSR